MCSLHSWYTSIYKAERAEHSVCRARSEPGGTRWRTGGEVKGKLANGLGSQYSSRHLRTWSIQHYSSWCAHLGCKQSTELMPPTDLNGLIRFGERQNLVCARVPSRSARAITQICSYIKKSKSSLNIKH